MKKPLKSDGIDALPAHINDVYRGSTDLFKLSWRGLDTWFDYLALKEIKRSIASS